MIALQPTLVPPPIPAPQPDLPPQPVQDPTFEPVPGVDAGSLRSQFVALGADMAKADAAFEAGAQQRAVPQQGASAELKALATRLDAARMGLAAARPGSELVARLGADVISVAADSGTLDIMNARQITFGPGWAKSLDRSIADVREAVALLGSGPVQPPVPGRPPVTPTPPSRPTPFPLDPATQTDLVRAVELINQSIAQLHGVPVEDTGSEATKAARIAAYKLNMEAQAAIEPHFQGGAPALGARLHTADAYLEDANWQLAKKPSPDGRFTGVDVPGARRDMGNAIDELENLLGIAPVRG